MLKKIICSMSACMLCVLGAYAFAVITDIDMSVLTRKVAEQRPELVKVEGFYQNTNSKEFIYIDEQDVVYRVMLKRVNPMSTTSSEARTEKRRKPYE